MALEKDEIINKLKEEGINENLSNGLSFETEEDLYSWVDTYKSGLPEPIKGLDAYTKEELEEIAKDPQFKGAKGLQGFIDSERQKFNKVAKKVKEDGAEAEIVDPEQPPQWMMDLINDVKSIKEEKQVERFDKLVHKLGKAEDLNDTHINRVKKGLNPAATESEIKEEIKNYKAEMAELGLKDFGTPGSGNSNRKFSQIDNIAKNYVETKKKQKK